MHWKNFFKLCKKSFSSYAKKSVYKFSFQTSIFFGTQKVLLNCKNNTRLTYTIRNAYAYYLTAIKSESEKNAFNIGVVHDFYYSQMLLKSYIYFKTRKPLNKFR